MSNEEKQLANFLKWKSLHEFKLRKESEYKRAIKKGIKKENLNQLKEIIKKTEDTMNKI